MSQSVLVQCPHCRAEGNLADPALFGKAISCPVCQQVFTAPYPAASEPPAAVTPAAVEPIAPPGIDTSLAATVSPPTVEAVQTPSAAEPLANASPAEVSAFQDVTSPAPAVEPIPAEASAPEQLAVAEVPVAATTEPVPVNPAAQFSSSEPLPVPGSAQLAVSTPTTAMNPATPVGFVPAAAVVPVTGQPPAAGQSGAVEALPVDGLPVATASAPPPVVTVPAAAPIAPAIAYPTAIPIAPPPPVDVPGASAAIVAAPVGPITFPGQVAAFPTEIALPQEGVFVPPPGVHTFDGPLPAFLAPPAAPGAEETRFAESLPEPVARGAVKPPKVPSKSTQTIIISTITVILLFATVMFLMGDPSRRFGKKPKSKEPEEDNPIARPLDSGPADQSIEDVFARINAASKPDDKKNDSDGSKEKK